MEWFFRLVSTPAPFIEEAVGLHVLSAGIVVLVAWYSFRVRSLSDTPYQHDKLLLGLMCIAFALSLRAIIDALVFMGILFPLANGFVSFDYGDWFAHSSVLFVLVFTYRLSLLLGYLCLALLTKNVPPSFSWGMSGLLVLLTIGSIGRFQLFHLAAFVLLLMIAHHFFRTYLVRSTHVSLCLGVSFLILAVAQFVLVFKDEVIPYVVGWLIQFAGYLGLLVSLILVYVNGKISIKV